MGSFGQNLRRERALRGISLEEIAEHTRISSRMLEAIENDRFELLPGGIFNRSFVLHYARYLGLDENQVGAEFDFAVGGTALDLKQVAAQREQRDTAPVALASGTPAAQKWQRAGLIALLVTGLLLLAGYTFREGWWPWHAGAGTASAHPAPADAAHAAAGGQAGGLPPPAATAAPAESTVAAASPGQPAPAERKTAETAARPAAPSTAAATEHVLRLQIDTMGAAWIEVFGDGRRKWGEEMRAGQTRTITADSSIELRTGNAGAVVLTLNGETQAPLGRKGEVKSVIFTPQDLKKQ